MDDSGNTSENRAGEGRLQPSQGAPAQAALTGVVTLQRCKRNQRIVVNMQDPISALMGTAKADIRVE